MTRNLTRERRTRRDKVRMTGAGGPRIRLAWPGAGIGGVIALTLGLATNQPTWTLVVIPAVMAAIGWVCVYFWQVDDSLGIENLRLSFGTSVALVLITAVPAIVMVVARY